MPSRDVYEKALSAGYRVDLNEYEKFDTLLSETDLNILFGLLNNFQDKRGNFPIITANTVVANPDFKKIEEGNFHEYHNETIIETFQKYPNHKNSFKMWMEGVEKGLLKFQYHAREHLNVSLFMNDLQNGNKDILWGFKHQMPGMISKSNNVRMPNHYVEATRFRDHNDMLDKMSMYFDGLKQFEELFGYKSLSVTPTNYLWNEAYNENLLKYGTIALQGNRKLVNPLNPKASKLRFVGKNKGIIHLVRNSFLELSLVKNKNRELENSLKRIEIAFRMNKPAIVSMHRINFSGEIFENNRDENIEIMYDWFNLIIKKWPDVEFISSDSLAKEIESSFRN